MNSHAAFCFSGVFANIIAAMPPVGSFAFGPGIGNTAVRHLKRPPTLSSATRSSDVDSVQMPILPAKKLCRAASCARFGILPSLSIRPTRPIARLPASLLKATVFSSAESIDPSCE